MKHIPLASIIIREGLAHVDRVVEPSDRMKPNLHVKTFRGA